MEGGVSAEDFKRAMASFTAGVTLITTVDEGGKPWGLTATAFSSVSKTPPLCLVCVAHSADALPTLRRSRTFVVNLLSKDQEALSSKFATHGADKFEGVEWEPAPVTGCPVVPGVLAAIECTVSSSLTAGDHDVFIGAIQSIRVNGGEPLAYFRGRYASVHPR